MTQTGLNFWEKLYIELWKNSNLIWNRRMRLIRVLLLSSSFLLILVALRVLVSVKHIDAVVSTPVNLEEQWKMVMERVTKDQEKINQHGIFLHNSFLPRLIVAFAPNTTSYKKLMEYASEKFLNNIELKGFENSWEVDLGMQTEHFLAGVIFNQSQEVANDEVMSRETFTDVNNTNYYDLDYRLVFPSELRYYTDSFVSFDWTTDVNFDAYHNYDYIDYIKEGFVSLQNAISMSFIRFVTKKQDIMPVKINRFARIDHYKDPLMENFSFSLSLIILVAYLAPCTQYTKNIVKEKSSHLKPILRVYGITGTIYAISWLFRGIALSFLSSTLLLIILKINWSEGFGICTYSAWTPLFFLILCYNVACTTFCFMIASMTKNPSTSVIIVGVTWFLTFMPYLGSQIQVALDTVTKVTICMFSNSLMAWALNEMIDLELQRRGLHWDTIFEKANKESFLAVGWACVLLLLFSIIYSILGFVMDDIMRLSSNFFLSWFQLLQTWVGRKETVRIGSQSKVEARKAKIIQIDNATRKLTIELKELTKVYHNEIAVDNVSLVFYQGEITVIMGHNASGKTTLLSLIAGVNRPTSGKVIYDELDVFKHLHFGYNIGISLQNNLYLDLTVKKLIAFYCRLKGMKSSEVPNEVDKYLQAMNLRDQSNVLVRNLPESKKINLKLCCALCGKSKYVVIDEPTKGMDTLDCRRLWSLLIREKVHRTIIISTQSVEEAEVVGDRLAILSGGELMCYGSPYFLKAIYGKGFRLVCLKEPSCNTNDVSDFLRKYIANIYPESEIGQELTYRLKERYALVFGKMLTDLEEAFVTLRICGCTIREPIVEDIFLSMGAENPSIDNSSRYIEIMNGFSTHVEEYNKLSFVQNHKTYRGLALFLYHIRSVLVKRLICNKRTIISILQLCMPAFVTLLTYLMDSAQKEPVALMPKTFRISHYPETVSVLSGHLFGATAFSQEEPHAKIPFGDLYSEGLGHSYISTGNITIDEFTLRKQHKDTEFDLKYLIGASIEGDTMIAWFNNYVPHTAPLSLNMAHNGILLLSGYMGRISVTLEPLPFEVLNRKPLMIDVSSLLSHDNFDYFLAINISFTICFTNTFLLMYLINEKTTRFKLLQFIGGMRHLGFYFGSLIYDLTKYIFIAFTISLIIFIRDDDNHVLAAGYFFLVISLFGVCVVPFYYTTSLLFTDDVLGYTLITSFTIYGVSAFSILGKVNLLSSQSLFTSILKWISYIIPHFALCEALTKIMKCTTRRGVCLTEEHKIISQLLDECKTYPSCCNKPEEFSWDEHGILNEITYFFVYGGICMTILFMYEYRTNLKRCLGLTVPFIDINLAKEEYERTHASSVMDTNDLVLEKLRISKLPQREYKYKPLLTINMGKNYGKNTAVHQFSIICERSECLGILGVNGSGKTTILNMLVGDESPTSGRAYVNGISLTDDLYRMYEHIGYCPHTDALPLYMTCREVLQFFYQLRGIPRKHVADMSLCLAKVLGFDKHYDRKLQDMTPGIMRRISTAISMVGNPAIIYLDDHTIGVDPAGRRQLFNITCRLCKLGKAIIITTQNTYDCEHFCDRLGFLYKGRFLCIDSVYNLKKRYVKSYLLQIKVKVVLRAPSFMDSENISLLHVSPNPLWNPFLKVMTFIEEEFPHSSINDHRGAIITYFIPAERTSISEIFKKLNRNAFILNIESFSIIHESLSLVLTDIAEKNKYLSSLAGR